MELTLKTWRQRMPFVFLCVLASAVYLWSVASLWRADRLQRRADRQSIEKAVHLEPWNADLYWSLGRDSLAVSGNPRDAISNLRRATMLNPFLGGGWLDLAAAYQSQGDSKQAMSALAHALNAEPAAPDIAWEAAILYLRQNDTGHAVPLLRLLIEHNAAQTDEALYLGWHATGNIDQMVSNVLPPQSQAYFRLLKILSTDQEAAAANQLWDALVARKLRFPVADAFPFFDYLIAGRQVDEAVQVWGYLRQLDSALQENDPSNLMVNGGFEKAQLNGGFAWRTEPRSQVEVSLDSNQFHSGVRSLGLVFLGPAVPDIGAYQYVPVQPNTTYRLTAFAKSEEIDSPIGPRLVVQDAYSHTTLASTDDLAGTSGWRQLVAEFTAGPEMRLVIVRITHLPDYLRIRGTFWLDDVSLSPTSSAESGHP